MNILEAYLFLFFDNLVTSLFFNIKPALVLDVMIMLGDYNQIIIFSTLICSSFFAMVVNYYFGVILHTVRQKMSSEFEIGWGFRLFGKFGAILSCVYIAGPFLGVFAGFLAVNKKLYFALGMISYISYFLFRLIISDHVTF